MTRRAREDILAVYREALAAADPERATARALRREGDELWVGGERLSLDRFDRVRLLGAGKAAAPMALAVEAALGDRLTSGLVVVKRGHGLPLARTRVLEASHPVPDASSLEAGRALFAEASGARDRDLAIVVLSGGASALCEIPEAGLSLEDLEATNELLLRSGAPIAEVNAARKHLSRFKGGGLAARLYPATVRTLLLSDVVSAPDHVIGSGPTLPDPSTFAEVRASLAARLDGGLRALPPRVHARLEAGVRSEVPETRKPGDPAFARARALTVGSNRLAAGAALEAARALGYRASIVRDDLAGEAREEARAITRHATGAPRGEPVCFLYGGETTVTVRGRGKGGRNQELALAAALALEGVTGITLGALATDGGDGPTDAAGAIVDETTAPRARALGLDPRAHLEENDAYPLLDATGDLVRTGPTRTNVNDLVIVTVGNESRGLNRRNDDLRQEG